ncbi:Uncharacterised protein [uncultured archaeon]|nr:Uncharacterised protein [uncultured archaeon]
MAKKNNAASVKSVMKLDERKTATAGAAIGLLGVLGMGSMMGSYGGYGMMGGYGFFPLGMLFGGIWSAIVGAVLGYAFAWVYNKA